MDHERERALTLAQEIEARKGYSTPDAVISRARAYLDFLRGTRDAAIIGAALEMASKIGGQYDKCRQ